jgi:hypothetical protein
MADPVSPEIEAVARQLCQNDGKDPNQLWPGTKTPAKTRPRPRWTWKVDDARKIVEAAAKARG